MKIICIGGLPGSGKTYLGKELAKKYGYMLFDDMDKESFYILREALKLDKSVIIIDTYFCLAKDRKDAMLTLKSISPFCNIEWILFENDPDACMYNVIKRDDGREVAQHIKNLSKDYDNTGVNNIVPVWKEAKINKS